MLEPVKSCLQVWLNFHFVTFCIVVGFVGRYRNTAARFTFAPDLRSILATYDDHHDDHHYLLSYPPDEGCGVFAHGLEAAL